LDFPAIGQRNADGVRPSKYSWTQKDTPIAKRGVDQSLKGARQTFNSTIQLAFERIEQFTADGINGPD
jgi:hypothetical protein